MNGLRREKIDYWVRLKLTADTNGAPCNKVVWERKFETQKAARAKQEEIAAYVINNFFEAERSAGIAAGPIRIDFDSDEDFERALVDCGVGWRAEGRDIVVTNGKQEKRVVLSLESAPAPQEEPEEDWVFDGGWVSSVPV